MLVLRYLKATEYHWAGKSRNHDHEGVLSRVIYQFMPVNWTTYEWDIFSSPRRWFGFLGMLVMWAVVELNCFFLKFVLWYPPPHPVVGVRLLIWFGIALPPPGNTTNGSLTRNPFFFEFFFFAFPFFLWSHSIYSFIIINLFSGM
eukprot:TRINITY_DN4499_c0_g1_i1.p1 TRINITY_DN4499_c0_g1~~TRINITY_DN4499_c0_g1_i1.p1  ORF type:complete len:145 (+),score=7.92 TRINITY_DN4499_c0_g1_i1:617-1051(+)